MDGQTIRCQRQPLLTLEFLLINPLKVGFLLLKWISDQKIKLDFYLQWNTFNCNLDEGTQSHVKGLD